MKKLSVLLVAIVVMVTASQAGADIFTDRVVEGIRLYWNDDFASDIAGYTDNYVEAAPGESVFIQLWINTQSNQGTGKNFVLNATWDDSIIESVATPGDYVTTDTSSYSMFRHYQSVTTDYGAQTVSYLPALDGLTITYASSSLYPYSWFDGGPHEADGYGPYAARLGTVQGLTPVEFMTTHGSALGLGTTATPASPIYGGLIAGFWVPIRSDAAVGSTAFFDVVVTSSGLWGGSGWGGSLTAAGQPAYAMTIKVVPEPATMGLLAIGGLAALLRRRR